MSRKKKKKKRRKATKSAGNSVSSRRRSADIHGHGSLPSMEKAGLTTSASGAETSGDVSDNSTDPRPGVLPRKPRLSVCMIVRDEKKLLLRCLKSVRAVADELIVVDTGSTDGTISVAKDFGARVFHFEWCDDFAAARNESIRHATSDWILQIDADEELLSAGIRDLKDCMLESTVLCYVIRCDNGPRCAGRRFHWLGRLFRNHPRIKYDRPYHESVDKSVEELITEEPRWQILHEASITIRHYGYQLSERHRKYERGIPIMTSYLEENPNDSFILTKLGNAFGGLGRYDEAEGYLKRALKIEPDSSETNYSLGVTLGQRNKLEAGIRCFKKAIATDPDFAEAYASLGAIYLQKEMLDSAIFELKKALAIDPDLLLGHSTLGAAYYMKGMLDEGIAHYRSVLRIHDDNANAHFNLGVAYSTKGMINETISEYKNAVASKSDFAEAHYNLAVAYYFAKEYELAIQHCDRATDLGLNIHPGFLEELETHR